MSKVVVQSLCNPTLHALHPPRAPHHCREQAAGTRPGCLCSGGQWHRWSSGMCFITESTCWPQPCHVARPQWEQLTL